MFTTWDQVRDWITDNNFKRWIFYKDANRTEKIVDSGAFTISDQTDKLAMTEKYLRMAGGCAYGSGFENNGVANATVCEVRLKEEMQMPMGMPMQPQMNVGEIEDRIRKQLKAEFAAEAYEKEKADFEKRVKDFEDKEKSVWGLAVNKLAPIAFAAMHGNSGGLGRAMREVAGVDAENDVPAARIVPADANNEMARMEDPEQEQDPFTDEESDKLFELMARFKKVEPRFLELIEAVVVMAENGDSNYNLAKSVLLK